MAVVVEGRCGLCRAVLLELCRSTDDPALCTAYVQYVADPSVNPDQVFRKAIVHAGPERVRLARDMLIRQAHAAS